MRYINKTRFFISTAILTLLFSIFISYADGTHRDIANSVVRLHIIANSDSAADQSLKLKVRDRVLQNAEDIFASAKTPSDALRLAGQNTDRLRKIAEDAVRREGYGYPVSVSVGKFPFPNKTYGDIMLPSGKYNAVRIIIGTGSGHNWWCVMYPPLCFTDGAVSISDENREKLKSSLSADEYDLICRNPSEMPVEVRFRLVEIIKNLF